MKRRSRLPLYAALLTALVSSTESGAQAPVPRRAVLGGSYCLPNASLQKIESPNLRLLNRTCIGKVNVREEVRILVNTVKAAHPDWVVYIERRGNGFYNYLDLKSVRDIPPISRVVPPLWDLFLSKRFSSHAMAEALWESFAIGLQPLMELCQRQRCRTAVLLPDEPQTTAALMRIIFQQSHSDAILLTLLSPNLSVNLHGPASRSGIEVHARELEEERMLQQILDIVRR